jgi:hypothetical protein
MTRLTDWLVTNVPDFFEVMRDGPHAQGKSNQRKRQGGVV